MSKVSYANLKLKIKQDVNTFDFEGNTIEILKYLPIEDKYSLVMVTLQKSLEDGIYNPIKLEQYFNLNLVYMYTNLSFTDKQREDESKIYDTLKSNGFIDMFLTNLDETEYDDLISYLEDEIDAEMTYKTTAAGVISKFIDDLPAQAQAAMNIVENFDKEKFQAVKDFAIAANGGREI